MDWKKILIELFRFLIAILAGAGGGSAVGLF